MAGYYMAVDKWRKTKENGKMKYIFFKTLILDFLLGIPFFIFVAPLIRNRFSFIYLDSYLKSSSILGDVLIYAVAIFTIRIVFRFCTWNYYECKYKDS